MARVLDPVVNMPLLTDPRRESCCALQMRRGPASVLPPAQILSAIECQP